MLVEDIDECGECEEGNPYESADDRSDLGPYIFRGVVRSWLMAIMPRPASKTSYAGWDCVEEVLLSS